MRIKQSMCYQLLQPEGVPLQEFFALVSETGFAAVEIWMRDDGFEEMVATAKVNNLVVASMIGHGSLPKGLNDPQNHDRIESELRESIDIAHRNGIPGLICFSGNRNPGQSDEEGMRICAEGLRRIAPYAEEKGVNLNVELLNSKVDHPGYQCDHTAWGVALCRMVDSPRVKLLYDIYHMQIMEGDIIRTIRENIRYIGHFHTAGNPGRHEMDDTQEMNYAGICSAIAASGYDLYVGHEFMPTGDRLASMRAAFALCDRE